MKFDPSFTNAILGKDGLPEKNPPGPYRADDRRRPVFNVTYHRAAAYCKAVGNGVAQVLGVRAAKTSARTTAYDPACGSGSLLLKVADEAASRPTLYDQEKDAATSGLARMNTIPRDNPEALIEQGNTLTDPTFRDGTPSRRSTTCSPTRRSRTSGGAPG